MLLMLWARGPLGAFRRALMFYLMIFHDHLYWLIRRTAHNAIGIFMVDVDIDIADELN